MSHKSNFVTVLQFDERQISRLRARRSAKGVEVVAYDAQPVGDDTLEAALKAFADKYEIRSDDVYSILPRHEITARILELPSQAIDEISGMIRLSCDEYVPYPPEELVIDQCILQKLPDDRAKVLAAFAHRDVVDAHIKMLKSAGIEPDQVFLSTACLASAALAVPGKAGRFALLNLESGGLEVIVINGNRLDYGRAVASSYDWTPPSDDEARAELDEEVKVELRASLSAYRRESEDGESVENIYLCADSTADVRSFCCSLSNDFSEPCEPAPFVPRIATKGAERLTAPALTALGGALLAQDRGEVAIRLLPDYIMASRRMSGMKQKAIRYGALAVTVIFAFVALYGQAVHQRKAYIRKLEAQISKIAPRAEGIASKQKQLSILKEQVERSQSVIELLAALSDAFPSSGMNVTRFLYSHRERIELWGRVKDLQVVDKLTEDLRNIGKSTYKQFARAQQAYTSTTVEQKKEVLDYKIIIPFNDSSDAADEEADIE